ARLRGGWWFGACGVTISAARNESEPLCPSDALPSQLGARMIVSRTLSPRRLTRQVMRHPLREHDEDLLCLWATSGSPTAVRFACSRFDTPVDPTDAFNTENRIAVGVSVRSCQSCARSFAGTASWCGPGTTAGGSKADRTVNL